MSITLTGTGGLMTRLGRIGKVANDMRTYQGTTLPANILSLMAQFDSLRTAVDGVPTADLDSRASVSQIMATLSTAAQNTLLAMVKADKPAASGSVEDALKELISQMRASADSVKACTVAASVAALSGNAGDGVCVVSTKRGDGLVQENIIPETSPILCVSDSQTGGATAGQESFTYTGEPSVDDVWSDTYPIGSGESTSLTAVDATQDASGNLLTNSDFESFTTNVPDNWTVLAGTAGTDFAKSTAQHYDGLASLEFIGGSGTPSLAQTFDSTTGTAGALQPDTVYAINLWLKADVVPAAGVLTVDLVDGSNATVSDDQSTANTLAVTLSGITTGWVAHNAFFRTPRALPSTTKIRVRVSTAISAGSNVFVDRLALTLATRLYEGGPYASVFSGATAFVVGDGFTLTTTNNYGGASNLSTFQQMVDRLFDMRGKDLVLPSSGSPTIADTLITS